MDLGRFAEPALPVLVSLTDGPKQPLASRDRRRPYRLAASGRAAISAQLDRIDGFVRLGRARAQVAEE